MIAYHWSMTIDTLTTSIWGTFKSLTPASTFANLTPTPLYPSGEASTLSVSTTPNHNFRRKNPSNFFLFTVPPDIIDEESSSDTLAKEGMLVTLICKAKGNPRTQIAWRREDGKPIRLCQTDKTIRSRGRASSGSAQRDCREGIEYWSYILDSIIKLKMSYSSSECSLRIRAVITSCEQARFRCLLLFSKQRRSSHRQQKSSTLRGL